MTSAQLTGPRRNVPWSQLSEAARGEAVSCAWIGSDGQYWPLTGQLAGSEGAFITGPIDGMVHVPFEGIWTTPAYGPPRFERTVDGRREISFTLGLMSDSSLGWYDTEARFWRGCRKDATGYFTVTTRRHGQLWIPMQLLEAPKCALPDDPALQRVALHEIILAADGEPRWHRPDTSPPPFVRPPGGPSLGFIRIANRSTEPAWPIFFVQASKTAPSKVRLGDGPNAIVSGEENPFDDWPKLSRLFGIPFIDELLGTFTRTRDANMIDVPELNPGEHCIIDTDPAHRIAITAQDPPDNLLKKFIRNSELLNWILGEYGDTGLPLLQRFKGQGFSIPIPPRTVATIPVSHNQPGGKIWCQLPQRFESALA
ncbi:hypothetical protein [Mycobacteroides abscessus]|uniref:hypothetical protein n=1 Tax=Mycobacteroides abscessus TaxID=36809 RepID=UPI000C25EB44|nr:hypothetical protein [Mycobacteroides abscessus]